MNKLKASGIALAAAIGTVAGIAMLPGLGITASFNQGDSARPVAVQQTAPASAIVLLCTDCEGGSDRMPLGMTPSGGATFQQGASATSATSDTAMPLGALALHGSSNSGETANTAADAGGEATHPDGGGNGGWRSFATGARRGTTGTEGQAGSGLAASTGSPSTSGGTPVPGGTTQAGSDDSAKPADAQAATAPTAAPVHVACTMGPCETNGAAPPDTTIPPIASQPDAFNPEIVQETPSQREPEVQLPDLALAPTPNDSESLLPDKPSLALNERTVMTEEPRSVPEPVTAALMGIGLLAIGMASRRRKNWR